MERNRSVIEPDVPLAPSYVSETGDGETYSRRLLYSGGLQSFGFKSCADTVTPNFRQKMKAGTILNNSCLIQHEETDVGSSTYSGFIKNNPLNNWFSDGGSINHHWSKIFGNPNYDPFIMDESYIDRLRDQAKLFAISNIDSTPYSFMEDLAELMSTFRYLKQKSRVLNKAARDYQRKKAVSKSHFLNKKKDISAWESSAEMASLWLEYRFIINPIVRSLQDAMEAFNKRDVPYPKRWTARGKIEASENNAESFSAYYGNAHGFKQSHEHVEVKAGIMYNNTNTLSGWRFYLGLRNKDIPVTLWNILPLSFMVDRLINISASIKAVTNIADPSIEILTAWVTVKHGTDRNFIYTSYDDGWSQHALTGTPEKHKTFTYKRDPWALEFGDFIPGFTWGNVVSDATKIADLLSLTRTILLK